ncbi:hypothetical protein D3C84_1011770 [compost metagenome]
MAVHLRDFMSVILLRLQPVHPHCETVVRRKIKNKYIHDLVRIAHVRFIVLQEIRIRNNFLASLLQLFGIL